MNYDPGKVDDAVLALLWLTSFREKKDWPLRAWKGHDWDAMNRLCENGYISDPKSKAKSVLLTDESRGWGKQLQLHFLAGRKSTDEAVCLALFGS